MTADPEAPRIEPEEIVEMLLARKEVFVVVGVGRRRKLEVALRRVLLGRPELDWPRFSTRDSLRLHAGDGGCYFSSPLTASTEVMGRTLDAVVLAEPVSGPFVKAAIPALYARRGKIYWWQATE